MIKQTSPNLTSSFLEEIVNVFPVATQPIRPKSDSDMQILEGLLQGFAALCRSVGSPSNPMSLLVVSMRSAFNPLQHELSSSQAVLVQYAEMVLNHLENAGYHLDIVPQRSPANLVSIQMEPRMKPSSIQMGYLEDEIQSVANMISQLEGMEDAKIFSRIQVPIGISPTRLLR